MNRRHFLAAAAASSAFIVRAEEPIDSLPANILQNSVHNGLCMLRHPTPVRLSSIAQLTSINEPGEPLVVSGQVFAPDGSRAVSGVTVYAYNTDAQGHYTENHKLYPPRLYGWMKSDSEGRFEVRTILPGRYPAMQVPAHVHFYLWGAGYPLQWVDDLRFEGDSYLTPTMIEESAKLGPFRTISPLEKDGSGTWYCGLKIKLQRNMNFS